MLDGGRIFHVNINCTDLVASRAFYVDECGLSEGVRTTPDEVQSGTAFGLDQARWDAMILVGARGFDGGAIDLLQWLVPEPTGTPPTTLGQAGFQRIGVTVPGRHGLRRDPDGTVVELMDGDACRLAFVAVRASDLDRSVAFYRALGFVEVDRRAGDDGSAPTIEVRMDAPVAGEVQLVLVGSDTAADRPGTPRAANTLGMWRTALLLPDLDGAVTRLRAADADLVSDVQAMSMGPGLPDLRFVCFRGPDGEVIELIEAPT